MISNSRRPEESSIMKKKLLFVAIVLALVILAMMRYTLVEIDSPLPDDVKYGRIDQAVSWSA